MLNSPARISSNSTENDCRTNPWAYHEDAEQEGPNTQERTPVPVPTSKQALLRRRRSRSQTNGHPLYNPDADVEEAKGDFRGRETSFAFYGTRPRIMFSEEMFPNGSGSAMENEETTSKTPAETEVIVHEVRWLRIVPRSCTYRESNRLNQATPLQGSLSSTILPWQPSEVRTNFGQTTLYICERSSISPWMSLKRKCAQYDPLPARVRQRHYIHTLALVINHAGLHQNGPHLMTYILKLRKQYLRNRQGISDVSLYPSYLSSLRHLTQYQRLYRLNP